MNSKDITHLAHLSRLQLTDEEIDAYTKQFDEIVAYVDKIKEVTDIDRHSREGGDPVLDSRLCGNDMCVNVLREDEVSSYQNPEQIINEAPSHRDNFVKVKKILKQ
jgi:aspartyl-tRNA(Asn)/glutamyl-tRNA(Gln) amidotransferase subunit C